MASPSCRLCHHGHSAIFSMLARAELACVCLPELGSKASLLCRHTLKWYTTSFLCPSLPPQSRCRNAVRCGRFSGSRHLKCICKENSHAQGGCFSGYFHSLSSFVPPHTTPPGGNDTGSQKLCLSLLVQRCHGALASLGQQEISPHSFPCSRLRDADQAVWVLLFAVHRLLPLGWLQEACQGSEVYAGP